MKFRMSPFFFMKPDTALLRNNDPFYIPGWSNDLHHEVELVMKISKQGKGIEKKFAGRYFAEIGLGIDFTARDVQNQMRAKGLPWEKAKSFDYSAAISGRFISKEEFSSLQSIDFTLEINDIIVQKGNSSLMIFGFDDILSHVSKYVTLKVGDLIYTGTPAGVGPVKAGDRLRGFIGDKLMFDFIIK